MRFNILKDADCYFTFVLVQSENELDYFLELLRNNGMLCGEMPINLGTSMFSFDSDSRYACKCEGILFNLVYDEFRDHVSFAVNDTD